ncbi:predicted protein [Streptomyces viridochromogenes DSM 40736]|uniref:Predicted protein n=1 Tax=Streptomyces viridochromogenes (strain DSM 40736 / JCM 4977 / BCRC 1201 / Tue 494) TaxID=591159 RepID=D9X371_STRVT|nr:predicted protein [Streptomyces viridochromogenes DSM 40736]
MRSRWLAISAWAALRASSVFSVRSRQESLDHLVLGSLGTFLIRSRQLPPLRARTLTESIAQHLDTAAGAEAQDAFTFVEVGQRGRVAAAEGGGEGLSGQGVALVLVVQGGAEVVVDLDGFGCPTGGAARAPFI